VALYYALRRNADGMLNPMTGRYDGISTAYRIKASAAFVVDPGKPMDIPKLAAEEDRKAAFEGIKQAVIKGADSRVPQPVPPGTTEASFPALEQEMAGLPSKDYFLKTLDRPHYPGERAAPPQPKQPGQQVRNEAPIVADQ
jgi:hypothetical protein